MPDWNEFRAKAAKDISGKNGGSAVAEAAATSIIIDRVMINVSASGMAAPTVFVWEQNRDGGTPVDPPASYVLDGRKGTSNLIQVLVLVKADASSDSSSFYYGDAAPTIANDGEGVPITINSIGGGINVNGHLKGRYVNSDGTGPTGFLEMSFNPPNGRPEMIVDTKYAFGGWFESFITRGVGFSYRFRGGPSIGVNADVASGWPLADGLLRYNFPPHYRDNGGSRRAELENVGIVGFFGPGASAKKVCYSTTAASIPSRFVSATISDTTTVQWAGLSADDAKARVVAGGYGQATATCPAGSGNEWEEHLIFDDAQFEKDDAPPNFMGPFRRWTGGGFTGLIETKWAGGQVEVNWKYLPGVVNATGISGVGIFSRVVAAPPTNSRELDEIPCDGAFGVAAQGFVEQVRVPGASETINLSGHTNAQVTGNLLQVALCPYRDGVSGYMPSGIVFKPRGAGGGGGGGAATQVIAKPVGNVAAPTAATPMVSPQGSCLPVTVYFADGSGSPAYHSTATTTQITASVGDVNTNLYPGNDNDCTESGVPSLVIPIFGKQKTLFHYKTTNPSGTATINVADSTIGATQLPAATFPIQKIAAVAADEFIMWAPTDIVAYECFPVAFQYRGGGAVKHPVNAPTILYPAKPSALTYYSDANCNDYASSLVFSADISTIVWSARYTGGVSGALPLIPTGAGVAAIVPANVNVTQPGAAVKLAFEIPNTIPAETCAEAYLKAVDSLGRDTPVAGFEVTPLYNGSSSAGADAGVYSDLNCTTPLSTIEILPSNSRQKFWLRYNTQGALSLSGTVVPVGTPLDTAGITVAAPIVSYVSARISGVPYTPNPNISNFGTYATAQSYYLENPVSTFSIYLEGRTSLGTVVPTFSSMNLGPTGINLSTNFGASASITCVPSTPTWAAGVGTLTNCYVTNSAGVGSDLALQTGGSGSPMRNHMGAKFWLVEPTDAQVTYMFTSQFRHATGSCQAFMIGKAHPSLPGPVVVAQAVSLTGSNIVYHPNPDCTGGPITTINIDPGQSAVRVYGALSSPAPSGIAADGANLFDPDFGGAPSISSGSAGAFLGYKLVILKSFVWQACMPMMVNPMDAYGTSVPVTGGPYTVTFSDSNMNNTYYNDPMCSVPLPSGNQLSMNNGDRAKVIYVRPGVQTFGSPTAQINCTDGTNNGAVSGLSTY